MAPFDWAHADADAAAQLIVQASVTNPMRLTPAICVDIIVANKSMTRMHAMLRSFAR